MLAQIDFDKIQDTGIPTFFYKGQTDSVADIITKILPFVLGFAGLALLVYLILGGLQLMGAKGDPKAVQAAQGKITNAIIGFVIVIAASVVVSLIGEIFNIAEFKSLFGTEVPTP